MLALSFGSPLVKIARSHIHYLGKSIPNLQKAKQIIIKNQIQNLLTLKKKEGWLFPVLDWITPWIPNLNMDGYRGYPTWIPTYPLVVITFSKADAERLRLFERELRLTSDYYKSD